MFSTITDEEIKGKGVQGLPDTPGLSTAEMQAKFDELSRDVVIPKINELVGSLNETGIYGKQIAETVNDSDSEIPTSAAVVKSFAELGGGDMMRATYDKSKSGIVDDSEKLGGKSPDFYASKTDVENEAAERQRQIDEVASGQIPDEYLQARVDEYLANNDGGLATKEDIGNLSSEIADVKKVSGGSIKFTGQRYFEEHGQIKLYKYGIDANSGGVNTYEARCHSGFIDFIDEKVFLLFEGRSLESFECLFAKYSLDGEFVGFIGDKYYRMTVDDNTNEMEELYNLPNLEIGYKYIVVIKKRDDSNFTETEISNLESLIFLAKDNFDVDRDIEKYYPSFKYEYANSSVVKIPCINLGFNSNSKFYYYSYHVAGMSNRTSAIMPVYVEKGANICSGKKAKITYALLNAKDRTIINGAGQWLSSPLQITESGWYMFGTDIVDDTISIVKPTVDDNAETTNKLCVMSYNVQWFSGRNANTIMQNAILRKYNPDIIGLQEFREYTPCSDDTSDTSGMDVWSTIFRDYKYRHTAINGNYNYKGNASKFMMSDIVDKAFDNNVGQQRGYTSCKLSIGGKEVYWFNTHLSLLEDKSLQAQEILNLVSDKEYFIITGDLNTTCKSVSDTEYTAIIKPFVDAGYNVANCSKFGFLDTFMYGSSVGGETLCTDNIITSANISMDKVFVDNDKCGKMFSDENEIDHLALVAFLTIN